MEITNLEIPDVKLLKPEVFSDSRGTFYESFNENIFQEHIGKEVKFVQDNHSVSKKNVLRGIHFQKDPFSQGKLIRVVSGCVIDVAVDLRKKSKTFGEWVSKEISGENNHQLWIPEGFGHAFIVKSEYAHFLYKTTHFYNKDSEGCIKWDDEFLNIDWQTSKSKIIVSKKDEEGQSFEKFSKENIF